MFWILAYLGPKPHLQFCLFRHIQAFEYVQLDHNDVKFNGPLSLLKYTLFSTQPQCYLTFSRIELQMLLRCCLIHISIIMLRHFLYFLYLCLSRRRPIYVLSMWSNFHFHLNFYTHTSSLAHILELLWLIVFGWKRGWRMWIIFK